MSLARLLRLVVGLAFVAGGVSLATPLVQRLGQVVRAEMHAGHAVAAAGPGVAADGTAQALAVAEPARQADPSGLAAPYDAATVSGPAPQVHPNVQTGLVPGAGTIQMPGTADAPWMAPGVGGRPIAPPVPPAWSIGWEPAPPLAANYRSALETPPPPLLDESGPVGRSSPVAATPVANQPRHPNLQAPEPSTYRVRDGDDLAAIATRFYGHPNAAAAIHAANADLIRDPALLPIGLDIRLPPRWAFDHAGGATIEPRSATSPR